jgi:hypothetical protein
MFNKLCLERIVQLAKAGFKIEDSNNLGIGNILPLEIPSNYPHFKSKPTSIGYLFYNDGSYFIPISKDPVIRPYQIKISTLTPLLPTDIII